MNLEREAKTVAGIVSALALARAAVRKERAELAKATTELIDAQDARELLQRLVLGVQENTHRRIAHVVSTCLSVVFDDPYEFRIKFEKKRGRTEAMLLFRRDGMEIDPVTAAGGGMVDVAAFALRVSCLVLHRPRLSRILVLDEPFRFVSEQYQDNVRLMLEQLSKDLHLQIIFVTHNARLATGRIVEIK